MRGSVLYSYAQDCVLSADDHLVMQGLPMVAAAESMTSNEKRVLAGQAFSAPVSNLLFYIYYLNPYADWWEGEHEEGG